MTDYRFITALGTPLTGEDEIDTAGLDAHLADQHAAGIDSLLAGGTMGAMQALTDETWRALVERTLELGRNRFELMFGAGDTSFARTRERIQFLNGLDGVDGIVVLSPFFLRMTQEELTDYYEELADMCRAPMYLYDLPVLTGIALEPETVVRLAAHPNIAGIKCSGELDDTRRLIDRIGDRFRIIVAKPEQTDMLLRHGVRELLDGVYAIAPHWVCNLGRAAAAGRWDEAAVWQRKITEMRHLLFKFGVWGSFTAIMNARGIPGRFAPRPWRPLDDAAREALLGTAPVCELVKAEA